MNSALEKSKLLNRYLRIYGMTRAPAPEPEEVTPRASAVFLSKYGPVATNEFSDNTPAPNPNAKVIMA